MILKIPKWSIVPAPSLRTGIPIANIKHFMINKIHNSK